MKLNIFVIHEVGEFAKVFDALFPNRQHDAHVLAFRQAEYLKQRQVACVEASARVAAWVKSQCEKIGSVA